MSLANKGKNERQDQRVKGRGPPTRPIWNHAIWNVTRNRDSEGHVDPLSLNRGPYFVEKIENF